MIQQFGDTRVSILGDVHLGKKFENGVPLHRRGDREKLQWADFEASLGDVAACDVHVCMGDLFDRWAVPYEVIFRAAKLYIAAAAAHPDCQYVVLRGNHDASRDLERVSAFALFAELVRGSGVRVITSYGVHTNLVFFGWDPVLNAEQMVSAFVEEYRERIAQMDDAELYAFGHWDVVVIGENDNALPAISLANTNVVLAITGHDHTKRNTTIDGLDVMVTGSMQPYSFAEDPTGQLYVTTTLDDVMENPETFINKCVRIQLKTGESLKTPVDCLQLRIVPAERPDEDESVEVSMGDFNFDQLFKDAFEEEGVNDDFRLIAQQRWESERVKD